MNGKNNRVCEQSTEKLPVGMAFLKKYTPRKTLFRLTTAALITTFAFGGLSLMSGCSCSVESPVQEQLPVQEAVIVEETELYVQVIASGWNAETSTPVIIHIEGLNATGDKVEFYRAIPANEVQEIKLSDIGVDPATCTVKCISPINADGSIYKTPEPQKMDVSVDATMYEATFVLIPSEEVTTTQMTEILKAINTAVSMGDATLSGTAGTAVVEQAAENAQAAPEVDKEQTQVITETAKESVAEKPTVNVSGSKAPTTTEPEKSDNAVIIIPPVVDEETGTAGSSGNDESGKTPSLEENNPEDNNTTGSLAPVIPSNPSKDDVPSSDSSSNNTSNKDDNNGGTVNNDSNSNDSSSKDDSPGSSSSSGNAGVSGSGDDAGNVNNGSNNTGNGNGNSGSITTEPEVQVHTHSWTYHEPVTEKVWVSTEVQKKGYKCGTCGQVSTSAQEAVAHQESSGRGGCGAYATYYWVENEGAGYYETQVIKEAYYSCSCGQTKN